VLLNLYDNAHALYIRSYPNPTHEADCDWLWRKCAAQAGASATERDIEEECIYNVILLRASLEEIYNIDFEVDFGSGITQHVVPCRLLSAPSTPLSAPAGLQPQVPALLLC